MRALIASGGDAPDKGQFLFWAKDAQLIIGADSGIDWLLDFGVAPHLMLGDFDSADPASVAELQKRQVEKLTVPVEKDDTDTMLAARVAAERGAQEVILFGCLGGRLDHSLANLHVLEWLRQQGINARIADKDAEIFLVSGDFLLEGAAGETVSIFPFMGETWVTAPEGGFKYPLCKTHMDSVFCGVSNQLLKEKALLHIEGRAVILRNIGK
ncbi:MAG: thiamine diphosphokinase [Christensenellaceae bacterium]|nr:thiamine diphosphokinase [Christensenellaceae bacterium]